LGVTLVEADRATRDSTELRPGRSAFSEAEPIPRQRDADPERGPPIAVESYSVQSAMVLLCSVLVQAVMVADGWGLKQATQVMP